MVWVRIFVEKGKYAFYIKRGSSLVPSAPVCAPCVIGARVGTPILQQRPRGVLAGAVYGIPTPVPLQNRTPSDSPGGFGFHRHGTFLTARINCMVGRVAWTMDSPMFPSLSGFRLL